MAQVIVPTLIGVALLLLGWLLEKKGSAGAVLMAVGGLVSLLGLAALKRG